MVLHLLLALYIAAFAIAIGPLIASWFFYRRFSNKAFLDAMLIMAGGTLLLLSDAAKSYANAAFGGLHPSLIVFALACTAAGSLLMVFSLIDICFRLVSLPMPRAIRALSVVLPLGVAGLGVAKELSQRPLAGSIHGLAVASVYCLSASIILLNYRRVTDPGLRSLLRSFIILVGALLLFIAAQGVLESVADLPPEIRRAPFVQLAFQLCAGAVVIFHALKYLFSPGQGSGRTVPKDFLGRYGISEREGEIIDLMIKGLSNKEIGEKLFISAQTVKNHLYSIYRKAGIENKVQLMNLIQANAKN